MTEQRLHRGVRRGDQPRAVGCEDSILRGIDDASELAGGPDEILRADVACLASGHQGHREAVVPDGETGEASESPKRFLVHLARRPTARPHDHELPCHLALDHHGENDFPSGCRQAPRRSAFAGHDRAIRANVCEDARNCAPRSVGGQERGLRASQLLSGRDDAAERGPRIAGACQDANHRRQSCELPLGSRQCVGLRARTQTRSPPQARLKPRRPI